MLSLFPRTVLLLLLCPLLLPAAGCRRKGEPPSIPGARVVLPASAVKLFSAPPVSTKEFEAKDRRWDVRTSPRFNDGQVRRLPDPEGGMVLAEAPPQMAFLNRGNDCGSSNDRRVCVLSWEDVVVEVCGQPFNGNLDLVNDSLVDGALIVCRVLAPAASDADGGWVEQRRDCTESQRVPLKKFRPEDLSFRAGGTALYMDTEGSYDASVCRQVQETIRAPGGP